VQKFRELVAEADERGQKLKSLPQSLDGPDNEIHETRREIQTSILFSAWQLFRRRRKRRVPRATASVLLSDWPEAENLKENLQRVSNLEADWNSSFERLERFHNNRDETSEEGEFRAELATLFKLDRDLAESRKQFIENSQNFPALRSQLEPITATIRRLQLISDILQMAEEPEKFPDQADLTRLLESKKSLLKLRQKSDELVDAILAKKDQIDEILAAIFENFSSDRIDPVDRAILRLGAFEILYAATPQKVAINEAIQLAKRFGTTDSSRFVNGVLDKIARQAAEPSEKQDVL